MDRRKGTIRMIRIGLCLTNESSIQVYMKENFSSFRLNKRFSLCLWAKHVLRVHTIWDNRNKIMAKEVLIPFDSLPTQTKLKAIGKKLTFLKTSFHTIYG